MIRILYIAPGPATLESEPLKNKFNYLSKYFTGDILQPIWTIKGTSAEKKINAIKRACGNFHYHYTFSFHLPNPLRFIKNFLFYLIKGIQIYCCKAKYDIIISYGPFMTGVAGYILKIVTGKKFILELPGNPQKSFLYDEKTINVNKSVKYKIGGIITNFLLKHSDHIKLLYPQQINGFDIPHRQKVSIFHDFVPIKALKPNDFDERFILFLGFPWYLKGVDVLIKAFKKVHTHFPQYKLKIVGFCPEREYFDKLSENCSAIELCNAVKHEAAMNLLSRCSIFVLPSRTEAMGRVLLEAMATRKAIIASEVDGIPHYIKHNYNGLLFPSESSEKLATSLNIILANNELKSRIAKNGYECVNNYYSEEIYVEKFRLMVNSVINYSN